MRLSIISLSKFIRVDPEAVTAEDSNTPLRCAWINDHVATMGVLAEVAEASMEMRKVSSFTLVSTFKCKCRTSKTWALVEKEQERRWQREAISKLDELAYVVNMVALRVGADL